MIILKRICVWTSRQVVQIKGVCPAGSPLGPLLYFIDGATLAVQVLLLGIFFILPTSPGNLLNYCYAFVFASFFAAFNFGH